MKLSVRELVFCGVFTAVLCVLAPLSVPVGPVPISLATFAVMLAGTILGKKLGVISVLIYLLLGMVGLPVFAGWTAGAAKLAGPTGGYLVGYLPLAFICGFAKITGQKGRALLSMALCMILGTAVLYALGTVWFCVVTGSDTMRALGLCVIPFLPGDLLKIAAVMAIAPQVRKAVDSALAAER